MIVFNNITVRFGDLVAIDDVSLTLSERRTGVLGGNGSGKSTLARCVNALIRPDAGRVVVDGIDAARNPAAVRARVGFLFADADAQIVMPTVAEDLAYSLRGRPRAEVADRVGAALRRWGLEPYADHPCHLLSGGQKQALALAAVLLTEPAVLVADEPTTLLDLRNIRRLQTQLAGLTQQQLVITHHPDLLAGFDRVLVLDSGRVVCDDRPAAAIAFYDRLMR